MSSRPLRIGLSARIDHPLVGATGLQSKSLHYLGETAGKHLHEDCDRHSHAVEWAARSGLVKLHPHAFLAAARGRLG